MLNNDEFCARPKLVRAPIISVSNPLYNVVEVDIHAPPVSPIPLNSVVSDFQESFENIFDIGSAKLIRDPVQKIQGSTDKELRTRVYSEIQKKLRSYSGHQEVDPLLKTLLINSGFAKNKQFLKVVTTFPPLYCLVSLILPRLNLLVELHQ
jgi:hypothetical protein